MDQASNLTCYQPSWMSAITTNDSHGTTIENSGLHPIYPPSQLNLNQISTLATHNLMTSDILVIRFTLVIFHDWELS